MMVFQAEIDCPDYGRRRCHHLVLLPADLGVILLGEEVDDIPEATDDRLAQSDLFVISFAPTYQDGLAVGRRLRQQAEAHGINLEETTT